ncbi:MAG TPA: DUF192 domain-containing protein [Planctomycetes bacterium]|nr:DUF192 domain-containing protein [Planctomycetota bacterium]
MRALPLTREKDGALLATVQLAETFWTRFRGLMLTPPLAAEGGLWLKPCDSVHMLFMRYPIDVVFARRAGEAGDGGVRAEVLAVKQRVLPWLGMAWCRKATIAIELAAGRAAEFGVQAGDTLRLGPLRDAEQESQGASLQGREVEA